MTLKNIYESVLIELNKVQAPSVMISDFIYLFNKAVQAYINTRYSQFDQTQQLTDDLRVLTLTKKYNTSELQLTHDNTFKGNYQVTLPSDYWHILNCICEFEAVKPSVCEDCGGYIQYGANKLNTNQWPHVINNAYMEPSYKRPYYYIINVTDPSKKTVTSESVDAKTATAIAGNDKRYGNATIPVMQIKCGNERKYKLHAVYIDYLRTPEYLAFSQAQLDNPVDTTQVVEFPDYVIYEIINTLVTQILENHSDLRVQTQPAVSKTIA